MNVHKVCQECHHTGSCRFNAAGVQCYCHCHDIADAAPELLTACQSALGMIDKHRLMGGEIMAKIRSAISQAYAREKKDENLTPGP